MGCKNKELILLRYLRISKDLTTSENLKLALKIKKMAIKLIFGINKVRKFYKKKTILFNKKNPGKKCNKECNSQIH